MIGATSAGEGSLTIGVSMIDKSRRHGQLVNAHDEVNWNTKRNQNSQLRRGRITKTVLTHVALCGLEETRQQTNKIFNRVPRGTRSRTHTVYHADADYFRIPHDEVEY